MGLRRRFRRPPLLNVVSDEGGEAGIPVVLLHGIASSSVTFEHVLPLLTTEHRTITIDLLGFGESPVPADCDYTVAVHAASVVRTVTHLRLGGPCVLVGHSMGALIAARIASRHPHMVSRLVLVNPAIYVPSRALSHDAEKTAADFYLRMYAYLRTNKVFTMRNAARLSHILPIPGIPSITERNWTPFIKSLENTIESQTTISDMAGVSAPIDIISGSRDEFRSEGAMRIATRMSGVTTHRVDGSHHLIDHRLARVLATTIDTEGIASSTRNRSR